MKKGSLLGDALPLLWKSRGGDGDWNPDDHGTSGWGTYSCKTGRPGGNPPSVASICGTSARSLISSQASVIVDEMGWVLGPAWQGC